MYDRLPGYDLARAYAISVIVLAHTAGGFWRYLPAHTFGWYFNLALILFTQLGVPLFVMLSGALLLGKSQPPLIFYTRRFFRLIPPWFFYSFLALSLQLYLWWLSNQPPDPQSLKLQLFGTYWFVPLIAGLYFITPVLNYHLKKLPLLVPSLTLVWFCIFSLLPFVQILINPNQRPEGTDNLSLQYCGYYFLGFLLKHYQPKPKSWWLPALLCLALLQARLYSFVQPINQLIGSFTYLSPFTVLATILVFASFQPLKTLPEKIAPFIRLIATTSYGIYLFHPIVLIMMHYSLFDQPFIGYSIPPAFTGLVFATATLIFSSSFVCVLQKIPLLKYLAG